jgi:hypothetical protein
MTTNLYSLNHVVTPAYVRPGEIALHKLRHVPAPALLPPRLHFSISHPSL